VAAEKPLLVDQPIARAVRIVALPAMGSLVLRYANHAVDQFWIGRLSQAANALAAIGAANFLIWAFYAQSALFNTGLQALVSRAVGAQDPVAKAKAEKHGLALAMQLGVVACLVGLAILDWVLSFQQITPEVKVLAKQYLVIILAGLPISYVGMAIGTIYRAEGDTLTPFRLAVLALVLNTVFDPPFIRGWGPLPAMGLAGSALVTVGVQLVQMLVLLALHRRKERPVTVAFELDQWGRFLKLGVPVAFSGTLFSFIYIVLVKVLAPFGTASVAALGLGHTIEGLPHFLCVGFAMAAATLVGQNLGAGRPEAAEQVTWKVVWYLALVIAPVALCYGLLAGPLLGVFMNPPDPEVIRIGTQYLRIAACVQLAHGFELVLWNAMTGAGYTGPTTALDIVILSLRIPVAYLLAHTLGLGPIGVWYSIGLMTVGGAVGMLVLFRRGTWKHKVV